ncbi:MAG: DUF1343 domain-containing protein [Clostridia bacterium]|nr:DUF1343 domain-containing protein [Deltaproteobacteria bacterium]
MKTGLSRLLDDPKRYLGSARIGLVANPTTVDERLRHAGDLLHAHPDVKLTQLFGPEHGIRGDAQYMVDVDDEHDARTGLPVSSLYGRTYASLTPRENELSRVDALVFDIQDVGVRYYTYAATMALCMQAAGNAGKKVIVLDRPNPIGGVQVEGGGLDPWLASFVGLYAIPHRHGMTVGELARLYTTRFGIACEVEVIGCEGWKRGDYYDATGLPWVMPSPNMPTVDTALVYAGMCLLEGTNVSEGRGTTRPFEYAGAPFVDSAALTRELLDYGLPGVLFRPCTFRPTFDKFTGVVCNGVQMHVIDREIFQSYRTGLAIVHALRNVYPTEFAWRADTYEFRHDVPAFDLLTGSAKVRKLIDSGAPFVDVLHTALQGAETYHASRHEALLY